MIFKHCALAGGAVAALFALAFSASAQEKYPARAVEIIVPFAPGGSTGLTARALAGALEERWGVPVKVNYKPGGNTVPAVQETMAATPDGYTVLADSPASASMLEVVVKKLPFGVLDRTFMGMVAQTPMIFVAPPNTSFTSLKDAIDRLKRDSESFTWTSLGGAGAQDYTFRQLFKAVDVEVRRTRAVASKGGAEAVTMTAGGHVLLGAGSWSAIGPLQAADKLKVLAVASPERFPTIPSVPTTAELELPSVQILFWFAISGPPGVPAHVIKAWDEAIAAVVKDDKFIKTLANIGMVPFYHDAAQFRGFVEREKTVVESLWAP
jgi:tripartite-type tricarboxylate transporter receptor subunit TctC